jgi:hypothetical protein
MKLAATQKEREAIEKTRYAACFYIYRNHLVHEFREQVMVLKTMTVAILPPITIA